MAHLADEYVVNEFQQISGASPGKIRAYAEHLRQAMAEADSVFIYRSHTHLKAEPPVVALARRLGAGSSRQVGMVFGKHDRIRQLRAADGGPVLRLDLTVPENRKAFADAFRISIRDFRSRIGLIDEMLVDDPVYDQYDYLFAKGSKVLLWTDIHELLLFKVRGL